MLLRQNPDLTTFSVFTAALLLSPLLYKHSRYAGLNTHTHTHTHKHLDFHPHTLLLKGSSPLFLRFTSVRAALRFTASLHSQKIRTAKLAGLKHLQSAENNPDRPGSDQCNLSYTLSALLCLYIAILKHLSASYCV